MPPGGPNNPNDPTAQLAAMSPQERQMLHESLQEMYAKGEALTKQQQQRLKLLLKENKIRQSGVESIKEQIEAYNELQKKTVELKKRLQELNDLGATRNKQQNQEREFLKNQIRSNHENLKQQDKTNMAWKRRLGHMKKGTEFLKRMLALTKGIAAAQQQFTNWDATMFNKSTVEGMANALSDLSARMNKVSGVGKDMTSVLTVQGSQMKNLGQTVKDLADSYSTLFPAMVDFGRESDTVQRDLMDHSFMMTKLNISYQDTAKFMNTATKAMKMGIPVAKEFQMNIAKMGKAIGMDIKQAQNNWQQSTSVILHYGNQQEAVFKKLLAQTKATGLEMNDLLGVAKGFDTFEGAAERVSQLNALLGTQMNSVEYLRMKEPERIEYLKQELAATGRSFAMMEKYEQLAIMKPLGMTDLEKATRLFGGSLSDIAEMEGELSPENLGIQDLNNSMDKSVGLVERRKAAQEAIMVEGAKQVKPALETQAKFMATSTELFDQLSKMAKQVGDAYKYMNEVGTNLMKSGFGREMIGRMTQMNAATSTWASTGGQVVGPLGSLTSMGLQVGMYRKLTKSLGQVGGASTKAASVTAAAARTAGTAGQLAFAGAGFAAPASSVAAATTGAGLTGGAGVAGAAGTAGATTGGTALAGAGIGALGTTAVIGGGVLAGLAAMGGLLHWIGSASDPRAVAKSRREIMGRTIRAQEMDTAGSYSPHRHRYLAQTLALIDGQSGNAWHKYEKKADKLLTSQYKKSKAPNKGFGPIIWPEAFDPEKLRKVIPKMLSGGVHTGRDAGLDAKKMAATLVHDGETLLVGRKPTQVMTPAQQQQMGGGRNQQAPVNIKVELGGVELANLQNVLLNSMNTNDRLA